MTQDTPLDPILRPYAALMETLVAQFGANCQVSLYDMREKRPRLVAYSGTVMEASIGSQLSEKLFTRFQEADNRPSGRLQFTATTPDGRSLSSSITILRGADDETIACMRIDLCIESLMHSIDMLQTFCNFDAPATQQPQFGNTHNEDVIGMVDAVVDEALGRNEALRTQDSRTYRMNIIRELEEKNVFLVKGAVDLIAARMNVSKFTIYNYIERIRNPQDAAATDASLRDVRSRRDGNH
ncbi:YheO domain-containing protein [Nitratireductor aquibiodomus RA22]|uniref:YheO domain-containing protein n=1 Tax=Nitratireductor aquibiodomus RA22 TaxID=1189611 RepID=I5C3W7_9HYPH|nr:helix-turn-helix domain-containing protein [Nitratireductor aquibiodomus]EIM76519.1 YheO domain-containing protein [Nitratireductor aquibiodomus RA22]